MSYTPINWQTGDTITAEKMNKMDNGWSVDTSTVTFFNETVTTTVDPDYPDDPAFADFTYSTPITADTLIVTFNGTDYTCQRLDGDAGSYVYGGWSDDSIDFSNYPFCIFSEEGSGLNYIATETGGTYTVSAGGSQTVLETSSDFSDACNSVVDTSMMPMLCVSGVTTQTQVLQAFSQGRLCVFFQNQALPAAGMRIITTLSSSSVSFIPSSASITASFVDGIFTVAVAVN